MKVFVSSTVIDLAEHRAAVSEMLTRMKAQISAMEFFGSNGDLAAPFCFSEIQSCDALVGIYAWRYGWKPPQDEISITEQEFDYARSSGKTCLCYIVDEGFPWVPSFIDQGDQASRLTKFKQKISQLVRSRFTTPDNLAKQVAADVARIISHAPAESVGGLLRVNWDVFAPELQIVLATAYSQARVDAKDGVVATRHLIAALAAVPNTGQALVTAFPKVDLPKLNEGLQAADVAEMYLYGRPFSSCILGSMNRLLPTHSPTEQLLAIELAVDLLKNGHGDSVAKFRQAGIDGRVVSKVENHIKQVANNHDNLRRSLDQLSDAEIIHLAYITGLPMQQGLMGAQLREYILHHTSTRGVATFLAGELIRRHPRLVGL